ncbi:MAG: UDP-N-acetylenolpyruvoylglucosamine reductase [Myxococcaceae bacterium]|nr:UDP-N-acetylenolpyruvoylglucosamine reductase [Myxococcaceae bacterium]
MSERGGRAHALAIEHARPLAPLTTLQLGGPAAYFVEVDTRDVLRDALEFARHHALAVGILGGGSNLIVADAGFSGLVAHIATRGVELTRDREHATLTAEAGEPWDELVELAVSEGLAGIECLAGIPGSIGAVPIQNVGAYGQEVSDVIDAVEVLERATGSTRWLTAAECAFGYRDSHFKRESDRYVVLAVRLVLRANGAPTLRYGELSRALSLERGAPTLREVQREVRALRANKGMLIGAGFEASAGSFFTNPIVSAEQAARVLSRALACAAVATADELPRFEVADGSVKLAAGWLIEHAGIAKGTRSGAVGVSSRHALALVHHGGGSTSELLALATQIQQQVDAAFGVALQIEPVRWGV